MAGAARSSKKKTVPAAVPAAFAASALESPTSESASPSSMASTATLTLTEIAVRNANDQYAAINQAVVLGTKARPKGTSRTYEPRQQRWKNFCAKRQFVDGVLVNEGKVLLWLQEDIIPAGNTAKATRSSKKKAKTASNAQADADEEEEERAALAAKTVDGYVTAAINLYQQQVSLSLNKAAHPRGEALGSYLDSLKREDRKRKRENFEDRAAGTI
ncbi:hypothetical protein CF326_g7831 [Tilletia indica]|uniref:Uncharacterized protein n=1 Tax=Tilletia indica TaxID=43049 RepID=A0A177T4C0_9BASI|nr:hypothetical protein CF326_g7831 [Tilletia indica]KAE8239490.1 hypothetical protein A4X13_0g8177 [Tilletia indica]